MNPGQRLVAPAATIVMVSLLLLATAPDSASGHQEFSKVLPQSFQSSSARQNYDYNNNDQSDSIDDALDPILNSHAINSFIDKMLAKYMGGLLAVNLVIIAAITLMVWAFVICALKPGFPVYNWREVGARSRYSRFSREDDEAPLHPVM